MTSDFRVDGLVSGLGTTDIVNSLMALERRPLQQLQRQQDAIANRTKALNAIKGRLTSLQTTLSTLTLQSTVRAKTALTDTPSTSPQKVTVSASSEAANGSFKVGVTQLATPTSLSNNGYLGDAIDVGAALASAGFAIAPNSDESRFFTITTVSGGVATARQITVDSSTVLSDGVDAIGANTILAKLRDAGIGLTASMENDAAGRSNRLRITAGAGVEIRLGAGNDTSNFLTVAKLKDAVQNGTQIESTANLGGVIPTQSLSSARLSTALTGLDGTGSGTFKINGVEISFNQTESLNTVLSRINSSTAGVTAAYDPISDQVRLTANATGSSTIAVENVTGNLLTSLGLVDGSGSPIGTQTVGQNAIYHISTVNGGQDLTSASNTVTGVLAGITLNLVEQTTADVTVTVSQNTTATVSSIRSFVSSFNDAMTAMRDATKYDPVTRLGGALVGDSTIMGITRQLNRLVTDRAIGTTGAYRSLGDIGISFGAVGSKVGATKDLVLDETKLNKALSDAPEAVAQLLAGFQSSSTLTGAAGQVAGFTGMADDHRNGAYTIVSNGTDADNNLSVTYTPDSGTASTATLYTLRVNGQNTLAIAGLTLIGKSVAEAGTQEIQVSVTTLGVMHTLNDYLKSAVGAAGPFATRESADNEETARLDRRLADMEARLKDKEASLYRRFATLETTMSRLRQQSSSLASALASLPTSQQ